MRKPGGIFVFIFFAGLACEAFSGPVVGAIRWDAWSGGPVTEQVEKTLAPVKHRYRLPWFARVSGDGSVSINGDSPDIMRKEIDYAADAGLDYWAFVCYPHESRLRLGLTNYLRAPNRSRIRFSLILHDHKLLRDDNWPAERDRYISYLKDSCYQTVLNGRPLVFTFQFKDSRFADFKKAASAAGLNPYYVFMGWSPVSDYKAYHPKGYHAVSAYAYGDYSKTFLQLAECCENKYWKAALDADVPCIPLVTTGWNKEPRKDHPVSWELTADYHEHTFFTPAAKPEEIASHLARGIDFVRNHPSVCPACAILCYAWNEHDEGGWLSPTLSTDNRPDTSRLDAVRKVLQGR